VKKFGQPKLTGLFTLSLCSKSTSELTIEQEVRQVVDSLLRIAEASRTSVST